MSTKSKSTKSKTDNSSEKYLDNLLNSIYGTDDGKGDSLVDQSAFLEQFENELENETYDEYLSEFEKELGDDDAKATGRAMDIQTPAPDDKDESLDEVLSDFDRKMKEQEEIPEGAPSRICEHCGKLYGMAGRSHNSKFCSDACYYQAARKRAAIMRKAKKEAAKNE